ncbi:MAG: hypothetical protein IPJ00_19070 [Saprospirales bacterium]|nr:hypothetical protein [Saprospirales bacterium]
MVSISGAEHRKPGSPVGDALVTHAQRQRFLTTMGDGLFLFEFCRQAELHSPPPNSAMWITGHDLRHGHPPAISSSSSLNSPLQTHRRRRGLLRLGFPLDWWISERWYLGFSLSLQTIAPRRFIDKIITFRIRQTHLGAPEIPFINNLSGRESAGFIAVKTGDVNGSADPA